MKKAFNTLLKLTTLEKIALFLSFSLAFFLNRIKIDSNDTWWQIKTGQWMVENGEIYSSEVFAFPVEGKLYVAYQWLSQVLFYVINNPSGTHLSYMILLVFFGISLLAFKNLAPNLKLTNTSILVFSAFSILLAFRNEARPHIFGLLFTTALCHFIWKWLDDKETRRFFWFIPIQIIWVNLHGSFLLSPALLFAFSFFLLTEKFIHQKFSLSSDMVEYKKICQLAAIGVLFLLLSLINPMGHRLLIKSFTMFFKDAYLNTSVHEWYGFFKMKWGLWAYLWMLWQFAGWLFLIIARKKARPFYWLLMALSLYFPISAIRYISLSAILSLPIFIKYKPEFKIFNENIFNKVSPTTLIFMFGLTCWVGLKGYPQTHFLFRDPGLGYNFKEIPLSVFTHLKSHGYKGRLLTHYNFGASVIYFSWPNIKVNIDSRTELYEKAELKRQELALKTDVNMKKYLKDHDIKFVFLPNIADVVKVYLEKDPEWILEKLDYEHFLYVRKDISLWGNTDKATVRELDFTPSKECLFMRLQGFCSFTTSCEKECSMTDFEVAKSMNLKDPNCVKFTGVCSNANFACSNCSDLCTDYLKFYKSFKKDFNDDLKEPNACLDLM